MLKSDALSQLKQLKSDIKASRNLQVGRVKGTGQKFGFITLESGKDVFVPPAEMLRVLPGDQVEVEIKKDEKNKTFAQIERLIESPNKVFFGRYVTKGPAHFVEADFDGSTRWIFIPPNKRLKTKEGELLKCKLAQHPIKQGKPQAHILDKLGLESSEGVAWRYSLAKQGVSQNWSEEADKIIADLSEADLEPLFAEREDLSDLNFFTIDGEHTEDMDDALEVSENKDGWLLRVAIADPHPLLSKFPSLEKEALTRAATLYSPGMVVSMLPKKISADLCSLVEGASRLAKVVELQVASSGELMSSDIRMAVIRSRKKLSFALASDSDAAGLAPEIRQQLSSLRDLSTALNAWRAENANLPNGKPEYFLELDEHKRLKSIRPRVSHVAQGWVEECMLLANRAAARYLKEQVGAGIYVTHGGLRKDRKDTLQDLLRKNVEVLSDADMENLGDFSKSLRLLKSDESLLDLQNVLTRQMERSHLSNEPSPHFGLGFELYTTFTSPLRKANDYLVHAMINAHMKDGKADNLGESQISAIESSQDKLRKAATDIEQWLKCQYLEGSTGTFRAEIVRVFTTGFQVRLVENGIEGVVNSRDLDGKCSFNADWMKMTTKQGEFKAGQMVEVQLKSIEWGRKVIQFRISVGN